MVYLGYMFLDDVDYLVVLSSLIPMSWLFSTGEEVCTYSIVIISWSSSNHLHDTAP